MADKSIVGVSDLIGLEKPLTKLVETVSAGIGTMYHPRAIRREAEAEAHRIKVLAQAQAEADANTQKRALEARLDRVRQLTASNPELLELAKQRILLREVEGQENVDAIVQQAALALPSQVDDEPVSDSWRRKFFLEAENICEKDLQVVWGKILAGEVAKPGTFNIRTLETMRALSRGEAQSFEKACALAMKGGWIPLPSGNINTALVPYGLTYNVIESLRDAGLLMHGDQKYSTVQPIPSVELAFLEYNGVQLQITGPFTARPLHLPILSLTQAGRELQSLIPHRPNEEYLKAVVGVIKSCTYTVKRGELMQTDDGHEMTAFSDDM